ncbi:hypothetical protein CWR48_04580 [Oceanobacillus arenosus]|uniref:MobA/VirD2-like nuclease domain-containing protein n=1 Tax=Oceanobacillus arenosus TaxID=1229153 RepID=A0A3D8PXG6_9BACI|nr:relaxase/mobilization nuclease domain-containing protein [Oceanobacillus arenosus]RDW20836.1 hypothetical protein CWR48_04580 [Oceanobacillus arenosus]
MATIKLGTTKSANKLINYAEKRAEVKEGVNCPAEYAKSQMKATRELWGKNDGLQAHHVIQSFKPGEVTSEQANIIGQELAKEMANGHEAVVYTHTDKDHIHNHIVINSVNYENGNKYQAHGKDAIENYRAASDKLCKEHNLSVIKEPSAEQRYHLAEYGMAQRGKVSWKDEIRDVIDHEKNHSKNYEDFKGNLQKKYNIEVKERGRNISFKHPDSQRFVRGKTLGLAYERGTLEDGFTRQIERGTGQERRTANLSYEQSRGSERTERVAEANERFERPHEKLHQNGHGQEHRTEDDIRRGNKQHQDHEQTSHDRNAFDIDEARKALEQQRRNVAKGFNRFTTKDEPKRESGTSTNEHDKQANRGEIDRDHKHNQDRIREYEQEKSAKLERNVSKDIGDDWER